MRSLTSVGIDKNNTITTNIGDSVEIRRFGEILIYLRDQNGPKSWTVHNFCSDRPFRPISKYIEYARRTLSRLVLIIAFRRIPTMIFNCGKFRKPDTNGRRRTRTARIFRPWPFFANGNLRFTARILEFSARL